MQRTITEFSFKNTAYTSDSQIELSILTPKKYYLCIPPSSNTILTIFFMTTIGKKMCIAIWTNFL